MQLHDTFFRREEHILDGAHFFPRRAALALSAAGADAYMIPASAIGRDNEKRSAVNVNLETAIPAIAAASHPTKLRAFLTVLVQRVQISHCVTAVLSVSKS